MQIIKPPLGIKAPLLGLGFPLSPPRLLSRKEYIFPPLLRRLVKPLTPIQGLGLSQFSPLLRASEVLHSFADEPLIGWDAELPNIEFETFALPNEEEAGKSDNKEAEQGGEESYLYTHGSENTGNQYSAKLTNQEPAKAKTNKKEAKAKTNKKEAKAKTNKKEAKAKSRSKSKKAAVAPAAAQKVYEEEFRSQEPEARMGSVLLKTDESLVQASDFMSDQDEKILIDTKTPSPITKGEAETTPILAAATLPSEQAQPGVLNSPANSSAAAIASPAAAMLNPEVLALNPTNAASSMSSPSEITVSPLAKGEAETTPVLAELIPLSEQAQPGVLNSPANSSAAAIASPAAAMLNPEVLALNPTNAASSMSSPSDITVSPLNTGEAETTPVLAELIPLSEQAQPGVLNSPANSSAAAIASPAAAMLNPEVLALNPTNAASSMSSPSEITVSPLNTGEAETTPILAELIPLSEQDQPGVLNSPANSSAAAIASPAAAMLNPEVLALNPTNAASSMSSPSDITVSPLNTGEAETTPILAALIPLSEQAQPGVLNSPANSSAAAIASPAAAMLNPEVLALNPTNAVNSMSSPSDITVSPLNTGEAETTPILAELIPPSEQDQPGVLNSPANSSAAAIASPAAAMLNPEVLALNPTNAVNSMSSPSDITVSPLNTGEAETTPILAELIPPSEQDQPGVLNSPANSSAAAIASPAAAMLNPEVLALNPTNAASSMSSPSDITVSPLNTGEAETTPILAALIPLGEQAQPGVLNSPANSSAAAIASPAAAMLNPEVLALNPTNAASSMSSPSDITVSPLNTGEAETTPILAALIPLGEQAQPGVLNSPANSSAAAIASPAPAMLNPEVLALNQSRSAPQQDINSENTVDESAKSDFTLLANTTGEAAGESSESTPVLAEPILPAEEDLPTLFRSSAGIEQPSVAELLPAVPNPEASDAPEIASPASPASPAPEIAPPAVSIPEIPYGVNAANVQSNPSALSGDSPGIKENTPLTEARTAEAQSTQRKSTGIKEDSPLTEVAKDTAFESLPPPKGFAVGGHVTASYTVGSQQVAPSDTVPAMLTPGEFVVNATDSQKNLNLLKHINTGGTVLDDLVTSHPPTSGRDEGDAASGETSTKVEYSKGSSVQRKSSEISLPRALGSLVPSSLGLETEKQSLSTLSSLQSNSFDNRTTEVNERSTHYSSTPLIFRKRNPNTHAPAQWSSIEDLLSGSESGESFDEFNPLSFSDVGFHRQNSAASTKPGSQRAFAKHLPQPKGFATGGEVTAPETLTVAQLKTKTIERPDSETPDADSSNLELLAREIYHRLRQRLELERERYGIYSGRLPW